MKIGILTFHSQLNYGGVLQCWALKEVLASMGHDVKVIDRWMDPLNVSIRGGYWKFTIREWLEFAFRGLMGCGQYRRLLRHTRTRKFVKALGLTNYHFYEWQEAPADLGVDCVIVGSDQVWRGGNWGDPRPYLLESAPEINAIAYAASFGMRTLSPKYDYASGFKRFTAISVREKEGVDLVAGAGYLKAVKHVVDPTLLLPREEWHKLAKPVKDNQRLVCYLLSENLELALPVIKSWAETYKWHVDILCDFYYKAFPHSISGFAKRIGEASPFNRVHLRLGYGPMEFVRAFARADACITDSFHAVMFSSIYGLNVRIIKPKTDERRSMFARLYEFGSTCTSGPVFVDDISSALLSLQSENRTAFKYEIIDGKRDQSLEWLNNALALVKRGVVMNSKEVK